MGVRGVARAGPGPLDHCPRLGCWRCASVANHPGKCRSPCCRYAAQLVCVSVNRGDCEFQVAVIGVGLTGPCCPGGQLARPAVPGALPQSHSYPLWLSTVGAALPSLCRKPPGSHRLWPHPSQLSLLHRPRLLVSLTCPKPGPNRHCAMAGATLCPPRYQQQIY